MELTVKDLELIERALMTQLERFGQGYKDFGIFLKEEFNTDWELTRIIHSKICNIIGEIEIALMYKETHPEVNQALNETIIIQKN
ncbi:MAG: hypothetical protein KDC67_06125 [Ignavibacteriae bacterium]|nr:hypothetical protein [Ignavibacteriota bacterium]